MASNLASLSPIFQPGEATDRLRKQKSSVYDKYNVTETRSKNAASNAQQKATNAFQTVMNNRARQAAATTSKPTTTATTTVPSKTGNKIVDSAYKYIGTPYVWGGESMNEGGMDCSGFVYNVLRDSGYDVYRDTAQGYRNRGTSVSRNELQPGDLIFYGNNGNATHIGVYIGDGQMIHSSGGSKNTKSNPGKGVVVGNVDYRNDFIEGRRL